MGGREREEGGGDGIPPSLRRALTEDASGPAESGMLQTAEPGSRRLHRQRGSRSALRTGPSVPGGPGLCLRRRWGLTSHGVDHGSGRLGKGTRGNTPSLWRFSAVVKCTPAVPFFSLPSSRGRREGPPQAKSLRQVRDCSLIGPAPPPPVTCKDSDTDLMVVVSKDHSLGRHVSQRSHRTDRSREKLEPGARGPGARSPRRARELGSQGSARRAGKEWEAVECSVACVGERPRRECAGPREGAESGRATPSPAGRRRAGGVGGRTGRARGGGGTRLKRLGPLCGARDPRQLDGRTERKGEHTLWRLRGRTRGQGRSYTLRRGTRGE